MGCRYCGSRTYRNWDRDWILRQGETNIKDAIFNYLKYKKVFCWNINNSAPYSPKAGSYLKPYRHSLSGVPDICGIYDERPLFIEVKQSKGAIAGNQHEFKRRAEDNGAIHIFARSVDDVQEIIN